VRVCVVVWGPYKGVLRALEITSVMVERQEVRIPSLSLTKLQHSREQLERYKHDWGSFIHSTQVLTGAKKWTQGNLRGRTFHLSQQVQQTALRGVNAVRLFQNYS